MRKVIHLFVAVSITFFFISCKKEESFEIGKDQPAIVNGVLRMKINGTQWVAENLAYATVIGNFIQINGLSKDNQTLNINLLDSTARTYILNQSGTDGGAILTEGANFGAIAYSTVDGIDSSDAGGTVIVTSIDKINKTISGTFKFKVFRDNDSSQKIITEGVFDKLSYSRNAPPASITDTFRVKTDNIDWSAKSISAVATGGSLMITGSELDVSKLTILSMPQTVTPGTYDFDYSGDYIGLYVLFSTNYFASESGKLVIIENNTATKRIRGNFNFKATELTGSRTAQLTEGYFSVKY